MNQPSEILRDFFGYNSFKPGQSEIIEHILAGKNVLAVLPTGAGKSICYQIPAICSSSFSIVVSPLIALMKDQVDALNRNEKIASFINSSMDYYETEKVFSDLSQNKIKLLYVSPERLSNVSFANRIAELKPEYLFIDEAHCISEWGHSFRPSYRKILDFINISKIEKYSAFTATATEEVRNDIVLQLGMKNPEIIVRGFERENLSLNIFITSSKREKVLELLQSRSGPAIIYSSTRKSTEELTEYCRKRGINCAFYHAGLTTDLRKMIQDDFINDRISCIITTNAFGMGIDKSNIRTIIHYNLPASIENYYQEIGRAGRDGNPAKVYLLFHDGDRNIQEYLINLSRPELQTIREVYDIILDSHSITLGSGQNTVINIDSNLRKYIESKNIPGSSLESILRILEQSGYLRNSGASKGYKCRILLAPDHLKKIISQIPEEIIRELLFNLLRDNGVSIFKNPSNLNITDLAQKNGISFNETINILKQISLSGIIEFSTPNNFLSYTLTGSRVLSKDLAIDFGNILDVHRNNLKKLQEMIDYIFTEDCRFRYILNYFGESLPNYKCSNCDICTGGISLSSGQLGYIEDKILITLHESSTPVKQKNIVQILSGKTNNQSLKKFSTFESCVHFKGDEIINSLHKLTSSQMILTSNDTYTLSEKGVKYFIESSPADNAAVQTDYENDIILFNKLKIVRKEIAYKFNQPEHLICSDELLREIVRKKPTGTSDLLSVEGFSMKRLNKIGNEFIEILKEHSKQFEFSEAVKSFESKEQLIQINDLLMKKYSLEDISKLCKLPESLVSKEIETILQMNKNIDIAHLFDKKEFSIINELINEGIRDLKALYEKTNKKISYSKLRIALAKFNSNSPLHSV